MHFTNPKDTQAQKRKLWDQDKCVIFSTFYYDMLHVLKADTSIYRFNILFLLSLLRFPLIPLFRTRVCVWCFSLSFNWCSFFVFIYFRLSKMMMEKEIYRILDQSLDSFPSRSSPILRTSWDFFFSSFPSAVLKRGAHNVTNAFFLFLVLSTRHLASGQQTHERVLNGAWLVIPDSTFCLTSVFIPWWSIFH